MIKPNGGSEEVGFAYELSKSGRGAAARRNPVHEGDTR